jgi:hypothetical protein
LLDRETIQDVERLVMSFADPDAELDTLDRDERLELRVGVMALLDALPTFDIKSKDWASKARDELKALLERIGKSVPSTSYRIQAPRGAGDVQLADIVGGPEAEPPIQTIHSVKGESHAATLLLAVDSEYMPSFNSASWLGSAGSEEVRVAYVALTRAQRYGAIALPKSCPQEIVEEYLRRGFVPVPSL